MDRKKIAVEHFNNGNNCAQSILLSFADDLNLDRTTAVNLASGFGAGMGRLQKTCGAVTGSFMVIGLHNSLIISDPEKRIKRTEELIQELEQDFSDQFGLSDCSYMIDADLKTESGKQEFKEKEMKKNICEKCVSACASWLENKL